MVIKSTNSIPFRFYCILHRLTGRALACDGLDCVFGAFGDQATNMFILIGDWIASLPRARAKTGKASQD
jgi:hypothetical protein